jgi:hypothetical protein
MPGFRGEDLSVQPGDKTWKPYHVLVEWIGAGLLYVESKTFSKIDYPYFRHGILTIGDEAEEYKEDLGFCLQCWRMEIPIFAYCGMGIKHFLP